MSVTRSIRLAVWVILPCCIGLFLGGCDVATPVGDGNRETKSSPSESRSSIQLDQTVLSTDGLCELAIPSSWKQLSGRRNGDNELFEIQVGKRSGFCEVVVLSEPIQDFDHMRLNDYADHTMTHFKRHLKNGYVDRGPFDFQLNGVKCKQYVIRGSSSGVNVVVLFSAIKGRKGYYQMISYTSPSKLEKVKDELLAVVRSFRER